MATSIQKKFIKLFSMQLITDELKTSNMCESRDTFNARLNNFYQDVKNSLLVAVCGEIGNNSFDHNLGHWHDTVGVYFEHDVKNRTIVIGDRGQGIRKTLSRIVSDIQSDQKALDIAFKTIVSGRSPEQRGNGLKFVAASVMKNNWVLIFYSDTACAEINSDMIKLTDSGKQIFGCLAIFTY